MDFQVKGSLFVICGATSGFGHAVAKALIHEGANVIVNARTESRLLEFKNKYPDQIEILAGDITTDKTLSELERKIHGRKLDGILINAGGPPAKSFLHTEIEDWDDAYASLLRWKIKITQLLLEKFQSQRYGRVVFIESISVKQPIENLVLSNSLRLAVVGFVKTLSQEVASEGITLNILAPGYHATPAMERLFVKKGMLLGITPEEARTEFEKEVKTGKLGDADDLASLALWLLSPHSQYITGQTISVDGGLALGTFG